MKYLASKGLCGLDLWVQCFTIATVQIVSSFMLMLLAVVRMLRPQSFIPDWTLLSADPHIKNAVLNENDQMAIELLVAAGGVFVASILLMVGLRKRSTTLIYPWIIISLAQLIGGMILFAVRLHGTRRWNDNVNSGHRVSFWKVAAVIAYHIIMIYFIHSVASYFELLKKMKRAGRTAAMLELSSGYPSSEMITFSMSGSQPRLNLIMEEEEESLPPVTPVHHQTRSIIINKNNITIQEGIRSDMPDTH